MTTPFVGRPPIFKTIEEFDAAIEEYFKSRLDEKGNWIKVPTVTGLAYALGMERFTLIRYKNRSQEFCDSVTRAKQMIEAFNEEMLMTAKNSSGVQFNMINNFKNWRHKSETDVKFKGGGDIAARILAARKRVKRDNSSDEKTPATDSEGDQGV